MANSYHLDQSFMQLISDAIFFFKASVETKNEFHSQSFSRASILNSTLSLEAAANCCLYHIDSSNQFTNDLEKMTTFAKLDVFAKIRKKIFIDRGCHAYQKVAELKKVRDSFVHPKKLKIPLALSLDEDKYEKFVELGLTLDGKPYPATKIDKSSMFWFSKDAKSALESIFGFYDYYFVDLLKIDNKAVLSLLGDRSVINDQNSFLLHSQSLEEHLDYLLKIGIKQKAIKLEAYRKLNRFDLVEK